MAEYTAGRVKRIIQDPNGVPAEEVWDVEIALEGIDFQKILFLRWIAAGHPPAAAAERWYITGDPEEEFNRLCEQLAGRLR